MGTALITGANRGIGLEFARQYAADGWKVIAACRDPENFRGKGSQVERLDISDAASISALARKLENVTIDLLINNAGILSGSEKKPSVDKDDSTQTLGSFDAASWNKTLSINCTAQFMITQAFLPNLSKSQNPKIAMISSRYGTFASVAEYSTEHYAYRASKAALNMASLILAQDLRKRGIIVTCLNPGWVKTDMGSSSADITPETSVSGMRQVIEGLNLEQTGKFFRYNGETVAW